MSEDITQEQADAAEQKVRDALQELANLAKAGALITGWVATVTGIVDNHPITFNMSPAGQPSPHDHGLYRYGFAMAESVVNGITTHHIEDQEDE